MAGPTSPGQDGPNDVPPPLPEGWLAQWDGSSRKYYFVQRATGHSQWDIPTKPALSAPTPEPTPQGVDPFGKPIDTEPAPDAEYAGQDRGLLGDLATGALGGGGKNKKQSGLGGLAQSLLSGSQGGSHSGSQSKPSAANIGGQLLNSFLSGNKPHGNQQSGSSPSQGHGGPGSQSSHQHQGGGHMVSGLVGGLMHHHGDQQNQNFGYNPGQTTHSNYSGQAPSATYTPSGQSAPYVPPGAPNNPGSHSSTPFQSQATPQPYQSQPGHNAPQQQYHSPPPTQYHGSNTSTPAYGQPGNPYPGPPSGGPPSYGGQQHQQQHQQQQQQQPQYHSGVPPSFPPPPGQNNQTPSFPGPPSYAPPPGGAQASYYNQPPPGNPPAYSQPQGQYNHQNTGPPNHGGPPPGGNYGNQGNNPYGQNYPPPSAPSWR